MGFLTIFYKYIIQQYFIVTALELKEETKIAVEYLLRIFQYFPEIRFIVLVCSKI